MMVIWYCHLCAHVVVPAHVLQRWGALVADHHSTATATHSRLQLTTGVDNRLLRMRLWMATTQRRCSVLRNHSVGVIIATGVIIVIVVGGCAHHWDAHLTRGTVWPRVHVQILIVVAHPVVRWKSRIRCHSRLTRVRARLIVVVHLRPILRPTI